MSEFLKVTAIVILSLSLLIWSLLISIGLLESVSEYDKTFAGITEESSQFERKVPSNYT